MKTDKFSPLSVISALRRKNIALVYSFQNEEAAGFGHYDYWRFNVVSDWCKAVEQLGATPYILDVRTFGHKVINNSLPPIDFIINLNAGNQSLSTLGLVPSLAGFIGVPCIPNETLATVAGESKALANRVAVSHGIRVPKVLSPSQGGGIIRPDNYGSSCGVGIQQEGIDSKNELYQEFIKGIDCTIPLLYSPLTHRLETLPGIMYLPDSRDMSWFLGKKEKTQHKGYVKISFQIKTLCRVDTRIECSDYRMLETIRKEPISLSHLRFIEINAMPTINEGINYCNTLNGLSKQHPLGEVRAECLSLIPDMQETTFVLFCSICGYLDNQNEQHC